MSLLANIIQEETACAGAISFARFMELALYHPDLGYYEQAASRIGRAGDFYTSVSVGSLFGELLAMQFAHWHEASPAAPFQIVEAGAHDGRLAADILRAWNSDHAASLAGVEYWILEPSPRRQAWQHETLGEFASQVRWFNSWDTIPASGVSGVIFANELLDAFPVRRLGWDAIARTWFEWGVRFENGRFTWARMPLAEPGGGTRGEGRGARGEGRGARAENGSQKPGADRQSPIPNCKCGPLPPITQSQIPRLEPPTSAAGPSQIINPKSEIRNLLRVLPDGFTIELCPAAVTWWSQAAAALRQGRLITFDYGLGEEQFWAPERLQGTLRAYYRHHLSDDLLANVGEQDLTAHVNFTALQAAGEAVGLKTEGWFSQAQFLTPIAMRIGLRSATAPAWSPARVRQFHTLTHPEYLGRTLSVLVQNRA